MYILISKIENVTNNVIFISYNPLFNLNPNGCLDSSKYCYGIVDINCSIIKLYNISQYRDESHFNGFFVETYGKMFH